MRKGYWKNKLNAYVYSNIRLNRCARTLYNNLNIIKYSLDCDCKANKIKNRKK